MLLCSRFLANSILKNIKKEVSTLQKKPGLGIILVGDRKDSKIYVNMNQTSNLYISSIPTHRRKSNISPSTIVITL